MLQNTRNHTLFNKSKEMREITLSQGYSALVDDEDYDKLTALGRWSVEHRGVRSYARRRDAGYMHVFIMKPQKGFDVDHDNGNGLDNRRKNLSIKTRSENMLNPNVITRIDNKSGKKGVYFDTWYNGWKAEIRIQGRKYNLGVYNDLEKAINARLDAEERLAKGLSPR